MYVTSSGPGSDSVDVFIRELDIWSIIPAGAISTSVFKIDLTERNFLGSGHEFHSSDTWYYAAASNAFNTSYVIPNIRNTYINASLHYAIDEYDNSSSSIRNRAAVFSPVTKWAAGVLLTGQFKKDSILYHAEGYVPFNFKLNSYDYWAGSAMRVSGNNTEKKIREART